MIWKQPNMWNIVLLNLLLFLESSIGDLCDENPTELCKRDSIPFADIPNDVNEFSSMCSEYTNYIDCLQLYNKECPDGYIIMFFSPGDFEINYQLINEICSNSSHLYAEYTKHVSCIKSTIDLYLNDCTVISESKSDDYFAYLRGKMKSGELKVQNILDDYFVGPPCLWHAYKVSCLVTQIENTCGIPASTVTTEIIQRSSYLLQSCYRHDYPKLQTGFLFFLEGTQESRFLENLTQPIEKK